MSYTPAHMLADFLEARGHELIGALLEHRDLLDETDMRPILDQLLANEVEQLRGGGSSTGEIMFMLADLLKVNGLGLDYAYATVSRWRPVAVKFLEDRVMDIELRELYGLILASEERCMRHLIEIFGDARQKLLTTERRRQQALAEAAGQAVVLVDTQGHIDFANPAMAEVLGMREERLIGRDFLEFCVDGTLAELRRMMRQKSPVGVRHFDGSVNTAKKATVPKHFAVSYIFDADGLRSGSAIALMPVEAEISLSPGLPTAEVHTITDTLGVGFVHIDASGGIVDVNETARCVFGLRAKGLPLCCHRHINAGGACTNCFRQRVMETGEAHFETIMHKVEPGGTRWIEIASAPMKDASGKVTGIVEVLRDVTERKTMEHQLLRHQNSSVSQLTVGVAHEMRNPLGVMLGFAEMLEQGKIPEATVRESAGKILSSGIRCKEIIDDLLEFGSDLPSERRMTDLSQLMREEVQPLLPPSASRRLEWRIATPMPKVECVPHQIAHVLTNLIDNALCFPGTNVVVETARMEDLVRITVTDDGPGIASDIRPRIFEPFFTSRREQGATGLGLSLSKSVIADHGGELLLDETLTVGSRFIIVLPIAQPAAKVKSSFAEPSAAPNLGRILLIDDELDLLEMLATALTQRRFSVDKAADGETALRFVQNNRYDLLISDVILPGKLGGKELFEVVRASHPELAAHTMFITADTINYDTRRFLQETGCSFMEKPFLISQFTQHVSGLIEAKCA